MADLIASLADDIIALINAKPSSPSKEEIAAVIGRYPLLTSEYLAALRQQVRDELLRTAIDAGELASFPSGLTSKPGHYAHFPRGADVFDENPPCRACGLLYRQWGSTACAGDLNAP